jgi:tetratricopeptide (TPR) repeat protein
MKHLKVKYLLFLSNIYKYLDGDYEKATELYTKAIEIHPDAVLYSNRSFANLRREWYGYALIDAKKALEYDPKYIKVNSFFYFISIFSFILGILSTGISSYGLRKIHFSFSRL